MKLKIKRGFSKRVQLKQFEPIESFCSIEGRFEIDDQLDDTKKTQIIQVNSKVLDDLCREEVEKTLNKFKSIDT